MQNGVGRRRPSHIAGMYSFLGTGGKWEDMGGGYGSEGEPFRLRTVGQNGNVT